MDLPSPPKDRAMLTERPFSLERLPGDPDAASIAALTSAIRGGWSARELAKRTRVDFRPEAADYPRVVAVPFE